MLYEKHDEGGEMMNHSTQTQRELHGTQWDRAIRDTLDAGALPDDIQQRLNRTYDAFNRIPQKPMVRKNYFKRGTMVVAAAAVCALFAGAAFAATNLFTMGSGDAPFFANDKELAVFKSMEPGAAALSAEVGQVSALNDMQVRLDSISCDRSVANLYFTLSKEGGFNIPSMAAYEGSQENEWSRLQSVIPPMGFTLTDNAGNQDIGPIRQLDAYMDGSDIKCMMRFIPKQVMADSVQLRIDLHGEHNSTSTFDIGLDMTNVPVPHGIGEQDLVFNSVDGAKNMHLNRFSVSELATVMVVQNEQETWKDENGIDVTGVPANKVNPYELKIQDDKGNVLVAVDPGDGLGFGADDEVIIEYAHVSSDIASVRFTPMIFNEAAARSELNMVSINVADTGAKIPVTEYGGYELASWNVADATVDFMLKPYGWVPSGFVPELMAKGEVPVLADEWTDPETGQTGTGYHSALMHSKWDYVSGELMVRYSYYRATDAELSAIREYTCAVYPAGVYSEDDAATIQVNFS